MKRRKLKTCAGLLLRLCISHPDYSIWHRDNFIKMQALVHVQFSPPHFQSLIKFAFYRCGYNIDLDEEPMQYCFDSIGDNCDTSVYANLHPVNFPCEGVNTQLDQFTDSVMLRCYPPKEIFS